MAKKKYNIVGILFLVLSISTILFSNLIRFRIEKKEIKKVENFLASSTKETDEENYIGILEIPIINLKRGFYDFDSKNNHVDKNIQMIETSLMPDIEYGNLILASHSGNSNISYFKNLYKLQMNDIAYIYYKDKKYTYQLINMYNEKKDGTIAIRRKSNQTNLTLITCDKKNNTLQNVYIFKMISD